MSGKQIKRARRRQRAHGVVNPRPDRGIPPFARETSGQANWHLVHARSGVRMYGAGQGFNDNQEDGTGNRGERAGS